MSARSSIKAPPKQVQLFLEINIRPNSAVIGAAAGGLRIEQICNAKWSLTDNPQQARTRTGRTDGTRTVFFYLFDSLSPPFFLSFIMAKIIYLFFPDWFRVRCLKPIKSKGAVCVCVCVCVCVWDGGAAITRGAPVSCRHSPFAGDGSIYSWSLKKACSKEITKDLRTHYS